MKRNEKTVVAKKTGKSNIKAVNTKIISDEEKINAWMNKLDQNVKAEIDSIRKIIRNASPGLNERIKWNAPSYYYKEDIVTFGPCKPGKILLVFHHPAIVTVKSRLLEGDYKDRRLVHFKNKADAHHNKNELVRIINEIVKSIDNN
ncbi:MAG: DUF1801 domain-containing protein [Chitinophagaceae bacterium]